MGGVRAIAPERRARASVRAVNSGVPDHVRNWGPEKGLTAVGWSAQRATDSARANTVRERRTNMRVSKGFLLGRLTTVVGGHSFGPIRSRSAHWNDTKVGPKCLLSSPKLARSESQ